MLVEGFNGNVERLKELANYHPVGKIGKPSDVAELAHFVASSGASFLNGSTITLSGGIHARLYDPI